MAILTTAGFAVCSPRVMALAPIDKDMATARACAVVDFMVFVSKGRRTISTLYDNEKEIL